MATAQLNKTTIDAAEPQAKDWFLWDSKLGGFGLKVTPSGNKIFVFQYRLGGRGAKVRRYTIGKFGGLTADKAREIAADLNYKVSRGIDPQAEKAEAVREAVDKAFSTYAERFIAEKLKLAWKSAHGDGATLLRRHAMPVLKGKALPKIERKDIRSVLSPVASKPATARNLFAVMRLLFNWAVEGGDLDRSPMEGMKPPESPPSRDRVLSDQELVLAWRAAGQLGYPFGGLVRMLALTGARREEIAGLEWSELDQASRQWTLPPSKSKNGVGAIFPLSDGACAELDLLAARAGRAKGWPRRGLVFSTTGNTPVSGFSKAKARLDAIISKAVADDADLEPLTPWRLHDLRRTVATGLQRLGVRFEVTEALLNHVSGARSGVAGVYQRHDWGPEKREAAKLWNALIESVLAGYFASSFVSSDGTHDDKAWRAFIVGWADRGGPPPRGLENVVSLKVPGNA